MKPPILLEKQIDRFKESGIKLNDPRIIVVVVVIAIIAVAVALSPDMHVDVTSVKR